MLRMKSLFWNIKSTRCLPWEKSNVTLTFISSGWFISQFIIPPEAWFVIALPFAIPSPPLWVVVTLLSLSGSTWCTWLLVHSTNEGVLFETIIPAPAPDPPPPWWVVSLNPPWLSSGEDVGPADGELSCSDLLVDTLCGVLGVVGWPWQMLVSLLGWSW